MNTNTDENKKAMSETNAFTVQEMVGEWGEGLNVLFGVGSTF